MAHDQTIVPRARGLLCGALLLMAGCWATSGASAAPSSPVSRGEYLARAGDCVSCHTAPGGKPYAGGLYMQTPFGKISTPNLTPDKETGIGAWTDEEFYRALHEGIGRHGEYLYPVFPFPWYSKVTREDVLAIKAYLFSLPAETAPRKPFSLVFPFNVRPALAAWRTLFFNADAPTPMTRGAYLVEGLGHCGECHNRHNVLGASQWSGRLEGGEIEGWYAPNITSDGREGVGRWSDDAIVKFLKTGVAPGPGVALGPMKETIHNSLRFLSDEDLHAIADYLKSVPAEKSYPDKPSLAYREARPPGAGAYLTHCASCHLPDGKGLPGVAPPLVGNGAVLARGPENVVRVILGGLPASGGLGPMPAVGAGLSDQEIADIVDYVRNSWGNAAPAGTGAGTVAEARAATHTVLAGNPEGGCPAVSDPRLAKVLDAGMGDSLAKAEGAEMLRVIDSAIARLRQADPSIAADVATNALTASFCRTVLADPRRPQALRAEQIGNFATLAYGQFLSPAFP